MKDRRKGTEKILQLRNPAIYYRFFKTVEIYWFGADSDSPKNLLGSFGKTHLAAVGEEAVEFVAVGCCACSNGYE